MKSKYNDNELLYLISENNEIAFEKMCEKYTPLIKSRLRSFHIKEKNYEDFFQECIITLYNCTLKYREDLSNTFNLYLDYSIQNCIKNLLKKEYKYFYGVMLVDDDIIDLYDNHDIKEEEEVYSNNKIIDIVNDLSLFEKEVLKLLEKGLTTKDIARILNKNARSIYNTVFRIKTKAKNNSPNPRISGIHGLSSLEELVYKYYQNGCKPKEIANIMGLEVTTIYNAIKRIKSKLRS